MVLPAAGAAIIARAMASARVGYAASGARGSFQGAMLVNSSGDKGVLELANLRELERELRNIGPQALRQFKKDAKKVGKPAVTSVRKAFRDVGDRGPLGAPKRWGRIYDKMYTRDGRGRLSWTTSRKIGGRSGIDVNYKNRKEGKALRDMQAAKDGTVSIVRVRVRAPAYVVADMAGKSKRAAKTTGTLSREYQINLFGRGVVTRQHRINSNNVDNWLSALDSRAKGGASKPSRYGYPALEKHSPKFKADVSLVLRNAIYDINRRLES